MQRRRCVAGVWVLTELCCCAVIPGQCPGLEIPLLSLVLTELCCCAVIPLQPQSASVLSVPTSSQCLASSQGGRGHAVMWRFRPELEDCWIASHYTNTPQTDTNSVLYLTCKDCWIRMKRSWSKWWGVKFAESVQLQIIFVASSPVVIYSSSSMLWNICTGDLYSL